MNKIKILVADDHEIVRRGLRTTLEEQRGWEVVGEAANGREAVALAKHVQPDVVVMDIGMPELNGLEATRQIQREVPATRVLILTVHEFEEVVREVLRAGAQGYLLKSDAGRDLIHAVRAVSQGETFFTSRVAKIVLKGFLEKGEPEEENRTVLLSRREREIVQLLAEGKTNKEVATTLGISVKTAETHRNAIMRKMDFHSIADLVHYAIRNKLVEA